MALESGRRLGHYEIAHQIGKGGMGEVYRARDTKLGREVAIKVLSAEFARDEERIARLEREARMLAALNHPNIAVIHGLEEADDTRFLVLELVEGDTLAERLKGGAVPVEQSLELALQIAEALEVSHEKGVIHRDLKPANIKVTPDGRVKVLDFGLAKAVSAGEGTDLSRVATRSETMTQAGTIQGTLPYMSPQQVRGEAVDAQADIWAFGCVLFEMLTGQQAFAGGTISDLIAAILRGAPEWKLLPGNLHPRVRELLERCQEPITRDRYHSMADVRVEIRRVLETGVRSDAVPSPQRGAFARLAPYLAAVALVLLAAGAWTLRRPAAGVVGRFDLVLPAEHALVDTGPGFAVSPDGTRIVYAATDANERDPQARLYARDIGDFESRLLPGTEGAESPFFSPEGDRVGYFADGRLYVTRLDLGQPRALSDEVGRGPFGTWGPDETIFLAARFSPIVSVSADTGGEPRIVLPDPGRIVNSLQVLDDGAILFGAVAGAGAAVYLLTPGSTEPKLVVAGGSGARYLSTGHLVYVAEGQVYAVPYDLGRHEGAQTGTPVLDRVRVIRGGGGVRMAIAGNGTVIYEPPVEDLISVVEVDRDGQVLAQIPDPVIGGYPRLSPPDGRRLVVVSAPAAGNADLWMHDLERGTAGEKITNGGLNIAPLWHPLGTGLAWASDVDGMLSTYWLPLGGTATRLLPEHERIHIPGSWHPNGDILALIELSDTGDERDIRIVDVRTGDSVAQIAGPAKEWLPAFSPNGRWLAYATDVNETDRFDVYVVPYPAMSPPTLVSADGGTEPLWCGNELFYRNGTTVFSVRMDSDGVAGEAQALFSGPYMDISDTAGPQYDVTPGCDGFAVVKYADSTEPIRVVLNWFTELLERVPVP